MHLRNGQIVGGMVTVQRFNRFEAFEKRLGEHHNAIGNLAKETKSDFNGAHAQLNKIIACFIEGFKHLEQIGNLRALSYKVTHLKRWLIAEKKKYLKKTVPEVMLDNHEIGPTLIAEKHIKLDVP